MPIAHTCTIILKGASRRKSTASTTSKQGRKIRKHIWRLRQLLPTIISIICSRRVYGEVNNTFGKLMRSCYIFNCCSMILHTILYSVYCSATWCVRCSTSSIEFHIRIVHKDSLFTAALIEEGRTRRRRPWQQRRHQPGSKKRAR